MKIIFEEIKRKQNVNTFCLKCGVKRVRVVSVSQTVNPWNCDPITKLPNSREQVKQNVRIELEAEVEILKKGIVCNKCCNRMAPSARAV